MTRQTIVLPKESILDFDPGEPGDAPITPINFTATPGDEKNDLAWDQVIGILRYYIFWDTTPGLTVNSNLIAVAFDVNTYEHTGLTNGTRYYYRIAAVGAAGLSGLSDEIDSKPTDFPNSYSTSFDGVDESVNCGNTNRQASTSARSVSAWINPTSSPTSQGAIVAKRRLASSAKGWSFELKTDGTLWFDLRSGTTIGLTVESDAGAVPYDQWSHVAFTYDGSSIAAGCQLYIDGVAVTTNTVANNLSGNTNNNYNFSLGSRDDLISRTSFFYGLLDEVAFYDDDLTALEISDIYNAGTPIDLQGLSSSADLNSWWRMGDGDTHPTIVDLEDGNDGTMINMAAGNFVTDTP